MTVSDAEEVRMKKPMSVAGVVVVVVVIVVTIRHYGSWANDSGSSVKLTGSGSNLLTVLVLILLGSLLGSGGGGLLGGGGGGGGGGGCRVLCLSWCTCCRCVRSWVVLGCSW